mmetsp:Transcript_13674/g.26101  ORF Transcript_13674/g.26101 Transcript_13674/m.26101 type:complete len:161 (-) Transcript_13674:135-617(-)
MRSSGGKGLLAWLAMLACMSTADLLAVQKSNATVIEPPCDLHCCSCAEQSYPNYDKGGAHCQPCPAWVGKYIIPEHRERCQQQKPCQTPITLAAPTNLKALLHSDAPPWNPLTANWVFAESPRRRGLSRRNRTLPQRMIDDALAADQRGGAPLVFPQPDV